MQNKKSYGQYPSNIVEGNKAEDEFINIRGENILRKANKTENIYEHWDVLDKEFGRVDVKASKRKYRGGPIDYSIHWWEFINVVGKKGWGVPNSLQRYIALRLEDRFILINPSVVNPILQSKCTEHFKGPWGLNTRSKDLAAMVPVQFFNKHKEHEVFFSDEI